MASAAPLDAQVLEAKLTPKSKVLVHHTLGDQVAILEISRPSVDLVEVLDRQRGALASGARRIAAGAETWSIALDLTRPGLSVRAQIAQKSGRLVVTVTEPLAPPTLPPAELIGRIPTLIPIAVAPAVLPPLPKAHPCPTRGPAQQLIDKASQLSTAQQAQLITQVVEEPCRSFLVGERARWVLERYERVDPDLERWAFQAARVARWARHPAAHAHTSLIAANVLIESGLYAEAETLLLAERMLKVQSLAPYLAYSLSRLLARNGHAAEAEELLAKLVAETQDSELLGAAWALRVEAAERAGDHNLGLSLVRQAARGLDPKVVPASVWLRGAELALVAATRDEAQKYFALAAANGQPRARAHAELRLGDLAVADQRPGWAQTAEAHYQKVQPPEVCFEQLLELRRLVGRRMNKDRLLSALERLAQANNCTPVRVEATYDQARLYGDWGEEERALGLVAQIRPEYGWPPGFRLAMERLEEELAASMLGRRAREHRFETVLDLAAGDLAPIVARLPADEQAILAEACLAVGLPQRAERLLLPLLKRAGADRVHLSELLARAYLEQGQADRAEMVLTYLAAQPSADRFFVRGARAQRALLAAKPVEALAWLDEAPAPPAGDVRAHLELIRAEALLALERPEPAALAYIEALSSSALDPHGVGYRLVSTCSRGCSKPTLERLIKVLERTKPELLAGDRVGWLLGARGVATSTVPQDPNSIWSRLRSSERLTAVERD